MNRGQASSTAKDPRARARFRGTVETTASCAWCATSFTYQRHNGRLRLFCQETCRILMRDARRRATEHYLTGHVKKLCPPSVNCWMCTGDFRGGLPLSASELPYRNGGPHV